MSIALEQVSKHFGNQWVVDHVSLEVADKELFVLLGASGSGKSTILRMIAGLSEPTSGRIVLHGSDVTNLSPQERNTGFVFQNYSIFRHMTVAENVEFGLRIRKTPKDERVRRREQLLDLVGLTGLGARFAHQLSGGQQQRVALARALAYEPNVLLLDEPFGALDVKIRAQLRRSLKEIQQRLGVTTILVTHDQDEAFELADRIGLLERGRLLEVGPSEDLYTQPRSLFTATFLGAGTVLVGRVENARAKFGTVSVPIPNGSRHDEGDPVQMLFRPEDVNLSLEEPSTALPLIGRGEIIEENFAGASRRVRLRVPKLPNTRQLGPPPPFGEEGFLIDALIPANASAGAKELWVGVQSWTILDPPDRKLLVCDEGRGSASSLAVAKFLANQLDATTTALSVAEDPNRVESLRSKLAERVESAGLGAAILRVRTGSPAEQIATEQAAALYDLVIMNSRPRAKTPRLPVLESRNLSRQLGKTLMAVLRYSDVPVLVAKGERSKIERILVCTAAGEPGKSDIREGGRLARRIGATVTLLYVNTGLQDMSAVTQRHLERAGSTLKALDVEPEMRIRNASSAAAGILAEAREGKHDLIVIGAHGPRTRIRSNDVMLQILATSGQHVMVVPADRV